MTEDWLNNIFHFHSTKRNNSIVIKVTLTAIGFALMWRLFCGNQSSRYYGLFYFLAVPALAVIVFYLPAVPLMIKRGALIIICLICSGKTLHFNPYDLHMQKACWLIKQEVAEDPTAVVVNYAGKKRDIRLRYYLGEHIDTIKLIPAYFQNSFATVLPNLLKSSAARDYQLILVTKVSGPERTKLLNMLQQYPDFKCIFDSPVNRSKKSFLMVFSIRKNQHALNYTQYADNILSSEEYLLSSNTSAHNLSAPPMGWSVKTNPAISALGQFTLHKDEASDFPELHFQDKGESVATLLKWLPADDYLVEIEGRSLKNSDLSIALVPWVTRSHALSHQVCFVKHFRDTIDFREYFLITKECLTAPEFTLAFQVNGHIIIKNISIKCRKTKVLSTPEKTVTPFINKWITEDKKINLLIICTANYFRTH